METEMAERHGNTVVSPVPETCIQRTVVSMISAQVVVILLKQTVVAACVNSHPCNAVAAIFTARIFPVGFNEELGKKWYKGENIGKLLFAHDDVHRENFQWATPPQSCIWIQS